MPFGMGFSELVLILIIVVVVFGATRLPQLGSLSEVTPRLLEQQRRTNLLRRLFRDQRSRRWKFSDWALVIAAVTLGAVVSANVLVAAFRRP